MTTLLDRSRPNRMIYRLPAGSVTAQPLRPAVVSITDPDLTTDGYNRALAAYTRMAQSIAM